MGRVLDWDYSEGARIAAGMKRLAEATSASAISCSSDVVLDGVSNAESYSSSFSAMVESYKKALICDGVNLDNKSVILFLGDYNLCNPDGSMNC